MVTTLSSIILEQLQKDKEISPEDATRLDDSTTLPPAIHDKLRQRFRFKIIRHRGSVGSTTTENLFKSFATALQSADPSLLILPYLASKQHYSPLATLKQIQLVDSNQMNQFFESFYHCQLYSLSGYLHISSQLSFNDITSLPKVQEWLDTNKYIIKLCSSQAEEMVPLGALCYSNVLMHREDLKEAFYNHLLWKTQFPTNSPIIDIYLGDFLASGKKEKMLFVSGEKSKQEELTKFFNILYNGDSKQYHNASMMLFIPFTEGMHMSQQYRYNILLNHLQNNDQGDVLAIGGLQDLSRMSHPLLFQHFQPNSSKSIHVAVFQKMDRDYVLARKNTLEAELRQVVNPADENKIFVDPQEGIWFGNVHQSKHRAIVKTAHHTKTGQAYANKVNSLLYSPPKKRTQSNTAATATQLT